MNRAAFEHSKVLADCIKPLKKDHITYFEHSRVYHDKRGFVTLNNPQFLEHFFKKGYSRPSASIYKKSGIFLWTAIPALLEFDTQIFDMKLNFNIDHGVSFINVYSGYIDIFDFASTSNCSEVVNFYINNKDLLYGFIEDYTVKCAKEIEKLAAIDMKVPLRPSTFSKHTKIRELSEILTLRELECVELLMQGNTAKMIARHFDVSYRTVEKHIENIKWKLDVHFKSQIIDIVKHYRDDV